MGQGWEKGVLGSGQKAQIPERNVRWGGSPEKMKKSREEAAATASGWKEDHMTLEDGGSPCNERRNLRWGKEG